MNFQRIILTGILVVTGSAIASVDGQNTGAPTKQPAGAAAYTPAQVASGKKIYAKQCGVCHFAGSTAKKVGPGLKDIYARGKYVGGKKVDDASMRAWIELGGKNMPPLKDVLKAEEIRDLLAYLHSI